MASTFPGCHTDSMVCTRRSKTPVSVAYERERLWQRGVMLSGSYAAARICVPPMSTATMRLIFPIITDPVTPNLRRQGRRRQIDSYFSPCYTHFMERLIQNVRELARWFKPGLGVKRWFLIVLVGITMLGVGLAIFLFEFYRTEPTSSLLL